MGPACQSFKTPLFVSLQPLETGFAADSVTATHLRHTQRVPLTIFYKHSSRLHKVTNLPAHGAHIPNVLPMSAHVCYLCTKSVHDETTALDLAADIGETNNLLETQAERAATMEATIMEGKKTAIPGT